LIAAFEAWWIANDFACDAEQARAKLAALVKSR
jgi:hypothetical protein